MRIRSFLKRNMCKQKQKDILVDDYLIDSRGEIEEEQQYISSIKYYFSF